ncbi:MAG: hypothetical protein UR26_C0004G0026 [candidate division TM6 bacterium GW2011_GWF2_32_72]|nr:MAG: hypothetical protein UR26_C0004G0026 [candidate division TM6 bacterium GW2011_GWF2_32_72]
MLNPSNKECFMKKLLLLLILFLSPRVFCHTTEENVKFVFKQSQKYPITSALFNMRMNVVEILKYKITDEENKEITKIEEQYIKTILDFFDKNIAKITVIYKKYFTDSEIEELFQFYNSDLGQKTITAYINIDKKLNPLFQSFTKMLQENIKESLISNEIKKEKLIITKKLTTTEENILKILEPFICEDFIKTLLATTIQNMPLSEDIKKDMQKELSNKAPEFTEQLKNFLKDKISEITIIYKEEYTDSEIEELTKLDQTSLNKKSIKDMSLFTSDISQITQPYLLQEFTKCIVEITELLQKNRQNYY